MVQRRLGAGAFGVVYEAYDRDTDHLVAIKVLRIAEADALYRFKKGFRSLADIRHPNLVSFYELLSEDGQWFLTLELIDGVDFITYLRQRPPASEATQSGSSSSWSAFALVQSAAPWSSTGVEAPAVLPASALDLPDAERRPATPPPDFDRVRDAVAQLARAIHTLHRHGKLHRDIKPSNVLVTRQGRVVVLDFGLVAELGPRGFQDSAVSQPAGTPAYMSPEQTESKPASAASDWYSVGVMLYQALSGQVPFRGSLIEMTAAKQRGLDGRLAELLPQVPPDLRALCEGLIKPRAEERLDGDDVLRRLAASRPPLALGSHTALPLPPRRKPFVGRGEALATLRQALEASRSRAVAVFVRGTSGMGKTSLVEHFFKGLASSGERAVTLAGRCYRQESVPYKAFDSLIDTLSRFLIQLPRHEVDALLPARIGALARLFPVLGRVRAIAMHETEADAADPQRRRRHAFQALRALLAKIAERRALILFIDDLHWGDVDSMSLLETLLRPPAAPPMLLIGCFRSEFLDSSPFLRALVETSASLRARGADLREIDAEELAPAEAQALAAALLGPSAPSARLDAMVREAGGSPFFLAELANFWRGDADAELPPSAEGDTEVRLVDVILRRVARLPGPARLVLETAAVAGKPLELDVLRQATGLGAESDDAVATLRASRLIRRRAADRGDEIEVYHDRIRETVVESLDLTILRSRHRALAMALESSGRADPETLLVHFQMTEDRERAGGYASSAAVLAEKALAFHRAARLYRLALELLPATSDDRFALVVKLAGALANAGHSREAADTYLEAVGDAGYLDPLELQRNAAEKLLISGHIERGLSVLGHVLRSVDMRLHRRPWHTLVHLWLRRLVLRWRGHDFEERPAAACDDRELRRIDICWSVEIGLCLVDVLHAAEFHARHLLLALRAGEPLRIARGQAMEVFFAIMDGGDTDRALALANELARRTESVYASGLTEMAAGMRDAVLGAWTVAQTRLTAAADELQEAGTGVAWELDTVACFQVVCRLYRGAWQGLFAELPEMLEQVAARGDRYLEVHLRLWVACWHHLAADRPEEAVREADQAIARWTYPGFHFQHLGHLLAVAQAALYRGDAEAAWSAVAARWRALTRSMIQRIPMIDAASLDLRARCALARAAAAARRDRARHLAAAERMAARLALGGGWTEALAAMVLAGVADRRGERAVAGQQLARAAAGFEAYDMRLHATVARRARAVLEGGDQGRRAIAAADAWLSDQGVCRPARLARVLAPGVGGADRD